MKGEPNLTLADDIDYLIAALGWEADWLAKREDSLSPRQAADLEALATRLMNVAQKREAA